MNRLDSNTVARIKACFDAGYSLRYTAQLVGASKATVAKYFLSFGPRPPCACGHPAGHRGWCVCRYEASPQRQAWIAEWRHRARWEDSSGRRTHRCEWCGTYSAGSLCVKCAIEIAYDANRERHYVEWYGKQLAAFRTRQIQVATIEDTATYRQERETWQTARKQFETTRKAIRAWQKSPPPVFAPGSTSSTS